MQFSIIFIFASLILTAFAAPNAKRTVAQIEDDIIAISALMDTWRSHIVAVPNTGASPTDVMNVHNDIANIVSAINTGIDDTKATPTISDSDSQAILTILQAILQPKWGSTFGQFDAKEEAYATFATISTLFTVDIEVFDSVATPFFNGLAAKAPASLSAQYTNVNENLIMILENARAAYS
ncbi:hypothetical protein BD779DRAFT_1465365 [Infundibulicybe gibba]|nr:hypothetical protein BD779DRAFT_1465365 [Infundibulicybe gibba]